MIPEFKVAGMLPTMEKNIGCNQLFTVVFFSKNPLTYGLRMKDNMIM